MQGGKAGEDSHRKFNAGWKTGRPWLDFRKVTTTDHDSAGNSVLVTAMFCKWCEMAGFNHNDRGKPTVWTDAGGGCQRAKVESVKDHEVTQTHKEAANLQMNQSDMKEAVKTAILQDDHVLLNLTSERGFSLRTQILTAQRHSMGDSLLACLMMICSNGPSLHEKEEVEKFLLAVVARFKAFKRRVQSKGCGAHPQRASASKAKSSVLSQLSGLENVVFNDFIDDELDSEDVSEQRASASLPDSVPIESEEERAAREADEMAALDAVGDYEADPNVMLEDVPQDIVIKTLKVSCACVPVLVFACVCVYVRARDVDMCS